MNANFYERVVVPTGRVDANGLIRRVKILGPVSLNGRTYTQTALRNAVPLYEGAKVNVNHPNSPGKQRSYEDRIGSLANVTYRDGALYGDLRFNPKHAMAEQLIWDAEHAPDNVGLSHNVEAKYSTKGGKTVVESIVRVISVDLVADPATTKGLFESQQLGDFPTDSAKQAAEEKIDATAKSIFSVIANGEGHVAERVATIAGMLRALVQSINNLEKSPATESASRRPAGFSESIGGRPAPDAGRSFAKDLTGRTRTPDEVKRFAKDICN